jgi:hypothetical protein
MKTKILIELIAVGLSISILTSCNNADNNKTSIKDLELQKRELDLKEKELKLKEKQLAYDSAQNANQKKTILQEPNSSTVITKPHTKAVSNANETPDYVNKFKGTWSNDYYPIIEIVFKNNKFRIRQCYGNDATDGTEFWGTYKNGKIIADGNARDFYKFSLPTFEVLKNGKLHYDCGAGPFELKKSDKKMPNANYSPPVNND